MVDSTAVIFGVCLLLGCGVANLCMNPEQLPPRVNESPTDIDLKATEGSDVVLHCTAPYAVKWIKLYQKNTTPISYSYYQLTNDTITVVTEQTIGTLNFNSTLQLIETFGGQQSPVLYACIAAADVEALTPTNGSLSSFDGLRVTKVSLTTTKVQGDLSLVEDLACVRLVRRKALTAEALLQTLNGDLLASNSATLTLEKWCGDHKLAGTAKIIAKQKHVGETPPPPPPLAQALLRITANETVRYRSVELSCGDKVLSVADNWYVSDRLTPEMNEALDTTTTPFGKVVAPFKPFRQTYSVKFLWRPLPNGWEMNCALPTVDALSEIPDRILEHQATVSTKDGEPISFVDERYTKSMFDFL